LINKRNRLKITINQQLRSELTGYEHGGLTLFFSSFRNGSEVEKGQQISPQYDGFPGIKFSERAGIFSFFSAVFNLEILIQPSLPDIILFYFL